MRKRVRLSRRVQCAAVAAGLAGALGAVSLARNAPVWLPTGRSIEVPRGPSVRTGTLPQGLALTPDGKLLLSLESGVLPPAVRIFDAHTLEERSVIALGGAYGAPLIDARGAWIAGGNADKLYHIAIARGALDQEVPLEEGCWPSAIARIPTGYAVACESAQRVFLLDEQMQNARRINVGRHPSALAVSPDGARLFVSAWGERSVDVVDLAGERVERRITVGEHPEALAISPDGGRLFVANADDDTLSVVDLRRIDGAAAVVPLFLDATERFGNSLNALAFSPDGRRLYVSAGGANAVYVLDVSQPRVRRLGAIPVGWYPTAVLADRDGATLYVADGKGEGSRPNPQFSPFARPSPRGYVAAELSGSIRAVAVPDEAGLRAGDGRVRQLAGDAPIHADPVVRPQGPIKHVVYIIKENRTYDQILGDVRGGDGDPSLVLFGEQVTPNQHALARRFGLFDRTFTNAHVSADGHNWAMAAFANEYVEKMWPPHYGDRRPTYDFEDAASAARPHSGYLWDLAARSGVSLRNYGEYVYDTTGNGSKQVGPAELLKHTDARYPGYNTGISDLDRVAEFEREFRDFERTGAWPALVLVRLGNDHTDGTKAGSLTPQAFVAQNDAAVGRLVELVSHSRYWASTAIFSIEDDCQNGPDHVDDQRTTLYIASPYARGGVHHASYTTAGVLRTIEIILDLAPLTTYDARALPLFDAFSKRPDLRPFEALAPRIDITARNGKTAYRARDAEKNIDSHQADTADSAALNDMLWHAVRGRAATPPPFGTFSQ